MGDVSRMESRGLSLTCAHPLVAVVVMTQVAEAVRDLSEDARARVMEGDVTLERCLAVIQALTTGKGPAPPPAHIVQAYIAALRWARRG
jgi:hypothetical protein